MYVGCFRRTKVCPEMTLAISLERETGYYAGIICQLQIKA